MGHLHDGVWVANQGFPLDSAGGYARPSSSFRAHVEDDPAAPHPLEPGRYHLYVSYACPWAHRTLIARALGGLESVIGVSVVQARMGEDGWSFAGDDDDGPPGATDDPIVGARRLWQVYTAAANDFTGRVTVPVLWDRKRATIVNNESREILRMLTTVFRRLGTPTVDLAPPALIPGIDDVLDRIYAPINNGVYRAGFARTQAAYEQAVHELFAALEHWESVLAARRFTTGEHLTEADVCLYTTLVRFDAVYHGHFKCNLRRIADYPNLWGFVRDVYQTPGVAAITRLDHIKHHYYRSHLHINPSGIVPLGPILDLDAAHGRAGAPR